MTSYADDTLVKGETVLLKGRIALRKYWINFIIGVLCLITAIPMFTMALTEPKAGFGFGMGIAYLLIALLCLAPPFIRQFTNELVLTNKRVIAKVGIMSIDATEIRLEKIEGISIKQSILGKLLNYGTLVVTGTGASHAIIPNISYPVIFKRQFTSALESLGTSAN